ncbi:MAG: hypothetical protein WA805_12860 [Trebonia sp.]|uniref:hypothetical protein n=1 Tax=Trebonia sp. TaxID=2767075 RepID=UPI003C9AD466
MSTTSPGRESSWICMVSGSSSWAALPLGAGAQAADLTDPALVCRLFGDLGDIDHLVFTAGEPLALMNLTPLDLDKAREFFALRTSARCGPYTPPRRTCSPAARSP